MKFRFTNAMLQSFTTNKDSGMMNDKDINDMKTMLLKK